MDPIYIGFNSVLLVTVSSKITDLKMKKKRILNLGIVIWGIQSHQLQFLPGLKSNLLRLVMDENVFIKVRYIFNKFLWARFIFNSIIEVLIVHNRIDTFENDYKLEEALSMLQSYGGGVWIGHGTSWWWSEHPSAGLLWPVSTCNRWWTY